MLDRIDLHIEAPALAIRELQNAQPGESSATIRARVQAARDRQLERFRGTKVTSNARMSHAQIRTHCAIDATLAEMLQHAMEELALSARAYDRIEANHLLEAIQYRSLDRNVFY